MPDCRLPMLLVPPRALQRGPPPRPAVAPEPKLLRAHPGALPTSTAAEKFTETYFQVKCILFETHSYFQRSKMEG